MNTKFELPKVDGRVVYVKPVDVADLPEDIREQAGALEQLYSVHDSDGQQLALVANRKLAFALAREHDMTPMTVH